MVELISSFRSSPVDCYGRAVVLFLHVGGLSFCLCCDVLCAMQIFADRINGAMQSVR
jgi:hypothetical protein